MRAALAPVAVALALRLLLVALAAPEQQRVFNSDSYQFHALARNLLETGRFTAEREAPFTPETVRTPLFPALAAVLYLGFGPAYAPVLVLNALLGALAVLLVARADPTLGPRAAWIVALDPTSVVYSAMFVAEVLLAVLLLGAVLLAARALEGRARRPRLSLLGAGLCAGAAALAKPAAVYFPAALLLALPWLRRRAAGVLPVAGLVLLGYAAWVLPWVVRNRVQAGITQVSSIQEVNLLFWNVGVLEGATRGWDFRSAEQELRRAVEARAGKPYDQMELAERVRAERAVALERIRARPLAYAWVHLRGALATALDPGRLDYARLLGGLDWSFGFLTVLTERGLAGVARELAGRPPLLVALLALTAAWLAALYVAAGRGLARAWPGLRGDALLTLSILAALYLALIGGPIGNARFRVPLVPYVALLAALGLERRSGAQASGRT